MIEVFKTNIRDPRKAKTLATMISIQFPDYRVNFDLDDCDKILRVVGERIDNAAIIELAASMDCLVEELADQIHTSSSTQIAGHLH